MNFLKQYFYAFMFFSLIGITRCTAQQTYCITYDCKIDGINFPTINYMTVFSQPNFTVKLLCNDTFAFSCTSQNKNIDVIKQYEKVGARRLYDHVNFTYSNKRGFCKVSYWPLVKKKLWYLIVLQSINGYMIAVRPKCF